MNALSPLFAPCDRNNPPAWVLEVRAEREAEAIANENRASNMSAFGLLTEKPSSIVVTGNQFSSVGV